MANLPILKVKTANFANQLKEFEITLEVSKFLNAPLNNINTVEALFNALKKKANINLCAVNFFKKNANELFIVSNLNLTHHLQKEILRKAAQASEKLSRNKTVLKDLTFTGKGYGKKLKDYKHINIASNDVTFGVLTIASAKGRITKPDLKFADMLARQFAIFLENDNDKQQIADEKNIIESIVQGMTEGVIFTDNNQKVFIANGAAKSILNIKSDIIGKKIYNYIRNKEILNILTVVNSDIGNFIYKEINLDDIIKPRKKVIRCYALKTLDKEGEAIGTTLVLNDITHEKEVDEARVEFLSTASHELRTPLSSIKESIELLMEDDKKNFNREQKNLLAIAHKNINRLVILVNDLLDLTKIESGKMKFTFEKTNIAGLIEEAVITFGIIAKEKSVELTVKIKKDLPEIYLDKQRILQVLANLLSNAIKFTPSGGKIVVEAAPYRFNDNFIQICVADSGIGIDKKDMPNLFKKFQQFAEAQPGGTKGSGLGLSITKDIINLHNGNIWVESEAGKGSRFVFILPIERRTRQTEQSKILVLTDDKNFADFLKTFLEKYDFHITFALNAKEAVKKLKILKPDLIMLDASASDIKTYKINHILSKTVDSSKTPVIMLTNLSVNKIKPADFKPKDAIGSFKKSAVLLEKEDLSKNLINTIQTLITKPG